MICLYICHDVILIITRSWDLKCRLGGARDHMTSYRYTYTAMQRQKAVSAYFTSKQILPFAFAFAIKELLLFAFAHSLWLMIQLWLSIYRSIVISQTIKADVNNRSIVWKCR